ncbi:hypothetical protein ECC02_002825 [Trypanosoma cruzi]|uniref:Uncharacterized protein n=1 Tax=Trypanosoma cruzi TaxID=5693 RepID=A0A7J6YCB1_TRYCR|nr:hypothetical protein ECC02_002825 [Trypanosoma cruzi]
MRCRFSVSPPHTSSHQLSPCTYFPSISHGGRLFFFCSCLRSPAVPPKHSTSLPNNAAVPMQLSLPCIRPDPRIYSKVTSFCPVMYVYVLFIYMYVCIHILLCFFTATFTLLHAAAAFRLILRQFFLCLFQLRLQRPVGWACHFALLQAVLHQPILVRELCHVVADAIREYHNAPLVRTKIFRCLQHTPHGGTTAPSDEERLFAVNLRRQRKAFLVSGLHPPINVLPFADIWHKIVPDALNEVRLRIQRYRGIGQNAPVRIDADNDNVGQQFL